MLQRCNNPKSPGYSRYGGRGIKVCWRWQERFENFLEDMGVRPDGTTLDRIDNDGDYEPGNCRWATGRQQQGNRDVTVKLTLGGRTMPLTDWARELGLNRTVLRNRLRRGWPEEEILTRPRRNYPR